MPDRCLHINVRIPFVGIHNTSFYPNCCVALKVEVLSFPSLAQPHRPAGYRAVLNSGEGRAVSRPSKNTNGPGPHIRWGLCFFLYSSGKTFCSHGMQSGTRGQCLLERCRSLSRRRSQNFREIQAKKINVAVRKMVTICKRLIA